MEQEFMLRIEFNRALNGYEQNNFWDNIVSCLRKIKAYGGGSQDVFNLNWGIDYSLTSLDEHTVKKHIASFLEQQKEIIKDYSFYTV